MDSVFCSLNVLAKCSHYIVMKIVNIYFKIKQKKKSFCKANVILKTILHSQLPSLCEEMNEKNINTSHGGYEQFLNVSPGVGRRV